MLSSLVYKKHGIGESRVQHLRAFYPVGGLKPRPGRCTEHEAKVKIAALRCRND
jgi:hypothetical protein